MRVAFNGIFLNTPHSGTGRYVSNLLRALGRVDGINEYHIFTPPLDRDAKAAPGRGRASTPPPLWEQTPSTFHWIEEPLPPLSRANENISKFAWEQHTFPAAARRVKARLLHVPYFAPPGQWGGSRIPVVATVHDVLPLADPAYRASVPVRGYMMLMSHTARRAEAIVAVSEFTKHEIMHHLGIPEERITVIREAPDPRFQRVTDERTLQRVREKYCVGERFVLNVGGMDVRKNIHGLVAGFAAAYYEAGMPDLNLCIVGNPGLLGSSQLFPDWRPLAKALAIEDRVLCVEVAEQDLPALYSAATCFVFTSRYEGFGLTPLEAMACGTPVVCSNRSAMPEVVGSAGILEDPDDTPRLGAAIRRLLSDAEARENFSQRGQAHAKRFSWDRAAAETSALYADVTGTGRE